MSDRQLAQQLHNKFLPVVIAMLNNGRSMRNIKDIAEVELESSVIVEAPGPLTWVCLFRLRFKDDREVTARQVYEIAHALDIFCNYEVGPGCYEEPLEVAGKKWVIGDGDDSGAVVFMNGGFNIWVRAFSELQG